MTKIDLTPIETEARALRAEVEGLREQLRQAQQAQRNTRDAALEEAALCCMADFEAFRLRQDFPYDQGRAHGGLALAAEIRALKTPTERARIARSGE